MAPPVRGVLSVLGAFLIQVILYLRVFRFYRIQVYTLINLYLNYIDYYSIHNTSVTKLYIFVANLTFSLS